MEIEFVFIILVLVFSVVAHELAHGVTADALGDPTARLAGRLTLNPIKHLDLVGSFIVPVLMYFLPGGVMFGWAKPVPYNSYNLRRGRLGEALVAGAGPLTNIGLALIFGFLVRAGLSSGFSPAFIEIAGYVVLVNLVLAIFNLIPIPPLDGSKILFSILPPRFANWRYALEQYGFIFVLIFVFFFIQVLFPVIGLAFSLLTGIGFS